MQNNNFAKNKPFPYKTSNYLEQFLNVYWLRPESAIWRAMDCHCLEHVLIESPSLDFGCGDGLFSFICFGKGEIDKGYDVYFDVGNTESFFQNADIYDHQADHRRQVLAQKPVINFDYALDHKENLLAKANRLSFYRELICADGNAPACLEKAIPQGVSTVFSNIVYWLNNPQATLKALANVIRKDGKIILMLPDVKFQDSSFYNLLYLRKQDPKWEFLKYIDRGRHSDNIKMAKSYSEWSECFKEAGLEIIEHKQYLSLQFMRMWDIGFRPIFPVLHKMVSKLNDADRNEIKAEWIEMLMQFCAPLLEIEKEAKEQDGTFHYFILTKS